MTEVITIDGPSGSGKSTIGRILAKRLNFIYLDTGAMYRAVALVADRSGIDPTDGRALGNICKDLDLHFKTDEDPPRLFSGKEDISMAIRTPEMDILSSKISSIPEVREAMTSLQRKMAEQGDIVTEGRDMGTVVFPEAGHKFFLTATPEVRAERRYKERLDRGESISKTLVETDMKKRDHQDQTRTLAPLRPADDAKLIDSTTLEPEQVVKVIQGHIKRK